MNPTPAPTPAPQPPPQPHWIVRYWWALAAGIIVIIALAYLYDRGRQVEGAPQSTNQTTKP